MVIRDADSLRIRKWALTGDTATPESEGLMRATGWPASYSQPGGDTPSREVFNQLFREITGMLFEINNHGGILGWDVTQQYRHPALVIYPGGGAIYRSKQDSMGQHPDTDATYTYWEPWFTAQPIQKIDTSGITDYDDINTVPGNGALGWGEISGSITDHRPFDYSGSGIIWLYNQGPASNQIQVVYPYSAMTPYGAYFMRARNPAGTYGAWGMLPTFCDVRIDGTDGSNQVITGHNFGTFRDFGVGIYEIEWQLDADTARLPNVNLTARDGANNGTFVYITDLSSTAVDFRSRNHSGALDDPQEIHIVAHIAPGAPA